MYLAETRYKNVPGGYETVLAKEDKTEEDRKWKENLENEITIEMQH